MAWVEGPAHAPVLKVAPVDVAGMLAAPAVGVGHRDRGAHQRHHPARASPAGSGCQPDELRRARRRQPVRLRATTRSSTAPRHLPDPRHPDYEAGDARRARRARSAPPAGARSRCSRAGGRCAPPPRRCATALPWPVLDPGRAAQARARSRAFSDRRDDVPVRHHGLLAGRRRPRAARCRSSSIDRLPFPRPDEPLLQARRERAGADAFRIIDLPRAATLLAQGAGRLIRRATDRGVVAVLDPRLASAGYRWRPRPRAAADAPHPRPRRTSSAFLAAARSRELTLSSRGGRAPWRGAASPCRP